MAGEKRQIDTLTFDAMGGRPERPGEIVQAIERPGRDYARWRKLGYRGVEAEIRTTEFVADFSLADAAIDACKVLAGTSVTIWDAGGIEYPNCTIIAVRVEQVRKVITETGSAVRLSAAWTVKQGDPR